MKYKMLVIPDQANILGVSRKYIVIGNDHKKAINMKYTLYVMVAAIAKQPGRNNIINVLAIGSKSLVLK
ncbi:hypothetical protein [Oceanobacillus senegalensis]|uniref:hypothetical protein n=1 Tax=Oceanobacillus senegalensis TaxID=1936063 RepID=UPI00117EADE3|nr:hypothetical protein [Oceanobacillus senegalensis]